MDKLPYVTGGGLEGRYNFVQLHFHWGSDSSHGSEHLINFRSYAAELHIVHYAQKYGTIAEATQSGRPTLLIVTPFKRPHSLSSKDRQEVLAKSAEVRRFSPALRGQLGPP